MTERTSAPPERTLVLHLPAFRLERCGYPADVVAGLVAERKSAARLVAITPAAREAGLAIGMTATESRARVPEVRLEPWDETGEAHDRAALLQSLGRFSDRVFPLGDDDVALGIERTERLFGGEAGLLAQAKAWVSELGHAVRAAIADEPIAAAALAGWADDDVIVAPGRAAVALAPLPILSLRPTPALAQALATVGVEALGDLARLEPAAVAGRYGAEGVRAHRIARGLLAGGGSPPGWVEVDPVAAHATLGGPATTLEPILFVLPGLLRQVAGGLVRRDQAAVRLALRLVLEGRPARTVRVRVGRPSRNPDVLLRVLRQRLRDLRLDAPVVEVQVEAEDVAPLPVWQIGLVDRAETREPLPDLLARLVDTLGEAALFSPEGVEDGCPERAWRAVPADPGAASEEALRPPTLPPRPRSGAKIDPVDAIERWERRVPRPRPTRLLPRPQPVEVRRVDGRPVSVHIEQGWERILAAEGPERLRGAWWSETQVFDRSYWVVRLSGGSGWIFEERARWYFHGWFD